MRRWHKHISQLRRNIKFINPQALAITARTTRNNRKGARGQFRASLNTKRKSCRKNGKVHSVILTRDLSRSSHRPCASAFSGQSISPTADGILRQIQVAETGVIGVADTDRRQNSTSSLFCAPSTPHKPMVRSDSVGHSA